MFWNSTRQSNRPDRYSVGFTPEDLFPRQLEPTMLMPTGVPMLDASMSGGPEAGDVAVILGATGQGRTTLATQILVSAAKLASRSATPEAGKLQVYFACNEPILSHQKRVFANAARVKQEAANLHKVALTDPCQVGGTFLESAPAAGR